MASVTIRLNSIGEVKEFNRIAATVPGDVDLHSGRYCVDAKSIMGIFSLDLSKPINLNIHAEGSTLDSIMAIVQPYVIE